MNDICAVEFFRSLDIKWADVFVEKLKELRKEKQIFRLKDFGDDSEEEILQWKDYFTIFLEIGPC